MNLSRAAVIVLKGPRSKCASDCNEARSADLVASCRIQAPWSRSSESAIISRHCHACLPVCLGYETEFGRHDSAAWCGRPGLPPPAALSCHLLGTSRSCRCPRSPYSRWWFFFLFLAKLFWEMPQKVRGEDVLFARRADLLSEAPKAASDVLGQHLIT